MMELNKYIDHTLLRPDATPEMIRSLCREAREYDFRAVCVNSYYVSLASKELSDSDVHVASVVGFPLGAMETSAKAYEADIACENGADEIDMVMNIGAMKAGDFETVLDDMSAVASIVYEHDAILKVILETCLLTDSEIVKACDIAVEAGADFVKTSTGFSSAGASCAHIELMKKAVDGRALVKASGGIRDRRTALEMISAGADRIGCSASVKIMEEK